jgi:hypothetical protein
MIITLTRASLASVLVTSLAYHAEQPLASQLSNAPVNDSVIAIGVIPTGRGNLYAERKGNAFVIYVGEAVQLDVRVVNGTGADIQLGNESRTWVDDLQLTVERQQPAQAGGNPVRIAAQPRTSVRGAVTLQPDRTTNTQLTLTTDAGQPLPPGTYTIAVELPTIASLGKGQNIVRRRVSFEVREPVAREDVLDSYLHQAYRARVENRPADERAWIDRVLAMHPGSLAAWLDLAARGESQNKPVLNVDD